MTDQEARKGPNRKTRRRLAALERKWVRQLRRKLRNRQPGDIVDIDGNLCVVVDPEREEAGGE